MTIYAAAVVDTPGDPFAGDSAAALLQALPASEESALRHRATP